jgi:glucose/arabinose dehydrogenase/type 1 glutamine amidotransferase
MSTLVPPAPAADIGRTRRRRLSNSTLCGAVALASTALLALSAPSTAAGASTPAAEPRLAAAAVTPTVPVKILVFHGPVAAQSDPVTQAVKAIQQLGKQNHFTVDESQDPASFTEANLAQYRDVVFLSADSVTLTADQESAFQSYIRAGNGFVGIHDAARAQPDSTWFTGLIGTRPTTSPDNVQQAVVEVSDQVHPATKDLPLEWTRSDQWLNWSPNPVYTVHTVARVRERSYVPGPGANGWDHPISWCRDYDGGRSFYTGMGRTDASYRDPRFMGHLLGAIGWTSGMVRGDCQATIASNYQLTRLTQPNQPGQLDQIGEPHGLTIAPDGRVFYIGRGGLMTGSPAPITDWNNPDVGLGQGTIHVYNPATGQVKHVATLDVFGNKGGGNEFVKSEEGLVGITLDPNFESNGWIYIYWMPHRTIDRVRHTGLRTISRFTYDLATDTFDLNSEKDLLQWEAQEDRCCHVGGGMVFDDSGNLYVSTGDNNSSECDGCAPAPSGYSGNNPVPAFMGLSQQDARRTAGNTNNLNGKILRIHPRPDGTYTVPSGNLFTGHEQGGGKTRPEIYAMGVRNATRLAWDPVNKWLLAGWVGPDANNPNLTWGPAKYETAAVITKPSNRGWPYCMGDKQPFRDRNLPDITQPLGWYDCDHPVNDSPNNTGLVNLPPVQANNIWYSPQGGGPEFTRDANGIPIYDVAHQTLTEPYLPGGGGQAIMPGPMYRYNAQSTSSVKWPQYWDGKWFIADESRPNTRVAVTMDPKTAPNGGAPTTADDLRSFIPTGTIGTWMDAKFGPDGALYVLNYGGNFGAGPNSALWRVTYKGGPPTPRPAVSATGQGTTVAFTGTGSGGVAYSWDFGDGTAVSHDANPRHTYAAAGNFTATLTVTYADGTASRTTNQVHA